MPSWSPLPPRYTETRTALHTVAEHVLAAARYRAVGHIGLRPVRGGITTPTFDGQRLEILGGDLVKYSGVDDVLREPITTLRSAGTLAGIEPGAPANVYRPTTPLDLDAGLEVDPVAAGAVTDWFELVSDALGRFAATHAGESPSEPQLWPEHFDLAVVMADVTYGGSPGDGDHTGPYLYVSPSPPLSGPFWNESFGASRPGSAVSSVTEAVAFLEAGHDAARPTE
jgi:hypothetical protein